MARPREFDEGAVLDAVIRRFWLHPDDSRRPVPQARQQAQHQQLTLLSKNHD